MKNDSFEHYETSYTWPLSVANDLDKQIPI